MKQADAGRRKRSPHRAVVLLVMLGVCTLFYYFGELVDWAAWETLRKQFFYSVHDIHRLLFLAPIIYAGYYARVRGAVIITMVTLLIFLPRAIFISPYPDPILRAGLFVIIAGALGCLTGVARNAWDQTRELESQLRSEKDKVLRIVDGMADGVVITGPDYKIHFMNARMVEEFGDGTGLTCYKHLHGLDAPCSQCRIEAVINKGEVDKWLCEFPDGRAYDVVAAPYLGDDGVVCQLAIFRNLGQKPARAPSSSGRHGSHQPR